MLCVILRLAIVSCALRWADGAKILGIFPNIGYSQFILGDTLMKELVKRGHEVTVISPFGQKNPVDNYTSITTDGLLKILTREDYYYLEAYDVFRSMMMVHDLGYAITEYTLSDEKVQSLLNSKEHFDLVLCEQFFNEAHYGFANHFNAPLVLFSSIGMTEWNNHIASNPFPIAYIPNSFLGYSGHMNYSQRLVNFFVYFFDLLYKHFISFPRQNALLNQYFPNPPRLSDLLYNASLVLLNSHPSTTITVPHVPNMIEIGGFHVQPKKLPQDLQEFLDGAKDGAIYFSMGSNLNSTNIERDKLDAILKSFSKLKQRILWKWEEGTFENKPSNIKISKWFPQQDILGHPNIRAFVTHGGLLSTTEAVYHGVPVIGIPIFGDQKMNIAVAVDNGFGIAVPFQEVTENKMSKALDDILNNPKYRENAQFRSEILADQPLTPMENAMFWIEYVLRHKNTKHLRIAGFDLPWYQYWLLDIFAFVIPIWAVLTFIGLSWFIVFWNYCQGSANVKVKSA